MCTVNTSQSHQDVHVHICISSNRCLLDHLVLHLKGSELASFGRFMSLVFPHPFVPSLDEQSCR